MKMSALDELITRYEESTDSYANASRDELSALRAKIAAQGEALAQIVTLTTDYAPDTVANMINQLARAAMTGEAQPATLTPRNCEACKRGAERMREAAAKIVDYMEIDSDNPQFSEIADRDDEMAVKIRALPLDCGDCNPLKPEA